MLKQFPKYKYVLAFCDYILLIFSFAAAILVRFSDVSLSELLDKPFLLPQSLFITIYCLIWIVIFQQFNLYKINFFLSVGEQITSIIKALIYGLIGMIVISFFIKGLDWTDSRAVTVYFITFAFFVISIFRLFIFRKLFILASRKKILQRKVLIVGTDEAAKSIAVRIGFSGNHGVKIIGFIDDKNCGVSRTVG